MDTVSFVLIFETDFLNIDFEDLPEKNDLLDFNNLENIVELYGIGNKRCCNFNIETPTPLGQEKFDSFRAKAFADIYGDKKKNIEQLEESENQLQ